MDPLAAFKNEVFRPIASIVLPGALSLGPGTVALSNALPELSKFYQEQTLIYFVMFLGASTIAGMLLENIGSSIERGIDRCMELEYLPGSQRIWGAYLAMECKDTYARKYLGSLVTRLKFINSMIPATFLFGVGIWMIHLQVGRWRLASMILFSALLTALIVWLFRTSTELSEAALYSRLKMLLPGHGIEIDEEADTVSRFRHMAYVLAELRSSRVSEVDFRGLEWWRLAFEVSSFLVVAVPKKRPSPASPTIFGDLD